MTYLECWKDLLLYLSYDDGNSTMNDRYGNYMSEPTRLPDDIEDLPSLAFVKLQHQNLSKDIDTVEEVTPHTEGKPCPDPVRIRV